MRFDTRMVPEQGYMEDDGCGMDAPILENLFEPFFTTRDVGQGSGLGLAMVDGIVSQNNGFVKVDTSPAGAAPFICFSPAIPVRPSPPEMAERFRGCRGVVI